MPTRPQFHRPRLQPARAEQRLSSYARGYDRNWERLRNWHLNENTFCVFCNDLATCVDHVVPITVGPTRRLDPTNLRSCCASCHGVLTAHYTATGRNEMPSVRPTHTTPGTVQKTGTTQVLAGVTGATG